MNPAELQQPLLHLVQQTAMQEGLNGTPVPGLFCYKVSKPGTVMPAVYEPCICIIVQGRKTVMLGPELLSYGPLQFLVASVDLPVIGTVTQASADAPYYVIQLTIDTRLLSELLLQLPQLARASKKAGPALFIGEAGPAMTQSLLRLFNLVRQPEDIPVLGGALVRELHYRMLQSEHGHAIAQISLHGTPTQRIAAAIQKLRKEYHQPIRIEELASQAGMSVSSFHAHFKAVTHMSPLQFQKSVRLMEARTLMLSQRLDATRTAYQVGYESPSQFSREYSRMFGQPPARDIALLRP